MNDPHHNDRLDEAALRRLDDLQLETLRFQLLDGDDIRYEQVVEHLLVRGIARIERITAELGDLRQLGRDQLRDVVIDASVRLLLRLGRHERLPTIETLASDLTVDCLNAVSPKPAVRPRLAPRRPQLRTMETQIGDAARDGRITPNRGGHS
jgi:hypothetical protein